MNPTSERPTRMKISVKLSHVIVLAVTALALVFGVGAAGAVAGAKWINGKDIKPHSIPANRLKDGVKGKQITGKIAGKQIANRSVGAQALTVDAVEELQPTVEYVERRLVTTQGINDSDYHMVPASCPEGTQAVAGYVHGGRTAQHDPGYDYVDTATGDFMVRIYSSAGDGSEAFADVQVMCLRP